MPAIVEMLVLCFYVYFMFIFRVALVDCIMLLGQQSLLNFLLSAVKNKVRLNKINKDIYADINTLPFNFFLRKTLILLVSTKALS